MSGPKSSRYTVSAIQREILRERLRREREAREKAALELSIKRENDRYAREIAEKDALARAESRRNQIEFVQEKCKNVKTEAFSLLRLLDGENINYSEEIKQKCHERIKEVQNIENALYSMDIKNVSKTSERLNTIMQQVLTETERVKSAVNNRIINTRLEIVKNLSSGFSLSFEGIADRNKLMDNKFLKLINNELEKINKLKISKDFESKFEQLRTRADEIKSIDYLENFLNISVIPFVKECIEYDRLEKESGDDYRRLILRYELIAEDLNKDIEQVPFSKDAISILLGKISELEEEELRIREEDYICNCIEEAMAEMNYSLIGNRSVTKKNGKKFRNVLYKFDEGTAVNVTYSNDGQITMELGGVDKEDRMPSEEESRSLEEDMRTFCDDFYEIEKTLKAKGIETKHISHLPAEAEYAQIINISDFEMSEEIGNYVTKKGKRNKSDSIGNVLRKE